VWVVVGAGKEVNREDGGRMWLMNFVYLYSYMNTTIKSAEIVLMGEDEDAEE
jgi:hypothetical protein